MTTLILSIIDSLLKMNLAALQNQSPEQSRILWDRYIEVSAPFHRLLMKIENLGSSDVTPKQTTSTPTTISTTEKK